SGEVLQLTQYNELTGSAIESDKPIGLFGGQQCTFIPGNHSFYCDTLDQQIPPLAYWGNEYAFVPSMSRRGNGGPGVPEVVPYRVVAAVDGTVLSYEGAAPDDAPIALSAGEAVTFMGLQPQPMVVRSQDTAHPFYAAVYMTGAIWPLWHSEGNCQQC